MIIMIMLTHLWYSPGSGPASTGRPHPGLGALDTREEARSKMIDTGDRVMSGL